MRHRERARLGVLATIAVMAFLSLAGAAMAQAPRASIVDFNGDGYADQAVGAPDEDLGSVVDAGYVHVLMGSRSGLGATGGRGFSQSEAGETAEAGDRFGAAVATGDFNGDGFTDLAVGAPEEDVGGHEDAGMVNVLYGSPGGLTSSGAQAFSHGAAGGLTEAGDRFGAALAAGDFNGDGRDDLAVGAPDEDVNDIVDAGYVQVLRGSSGGLTASGAQALSQTAAGESAEAGDRFGAALAAGDFNGDGRADLAVGAPDEDVGSVVDAGYLQVLPGSSGGVTASGAKAFSQTTAGGTPEAGDRFGGWTDAHLRPLKWPRPPLERPTTIQLGTGATSTTLDKSKDYVVKLPTTKKVGATSIVGGRNVVIVGGHITVPESAATAQERRALYIKDNGGTVHIEGVLIDSSGGSPSDALAISSPSSIVQIKNVRVDGLKGSQSGWHADIIQPFGGVNELRVDGLTGSSSYQGLFLRPDLKPIGATHLSRINLRHTPDGAGKLVWFTTGCDSPKARLAEVYVESETVNALGNLVWPTPWDTACPAEVEDGSASWPTLPVQGEVRNGAPPGGDFVPAGRAGVGYVSG
jgi:hypothetical protein